MNKKTNIVLIISCILIAYSCTSKQDSNVFLINKALRCKPASHYIIKVENENADSLSYLLQLKNIEKDTQEILIEFPIQQLDNVNAIQLENNTVIKQHTFVSKKLSQRIYYDRNIVFPFSLSPLKENTILFTFHKDDIHNYFNPELLVWKKDAKFNRTQALELTRGVFYGILILFAFICFLITFMLKEPNYYYYLLYLVSGIFYLFVKNNFGYELFWPDSPNLDVFFKKIMLSVYLITSILFLRGFIQKRIYMPNLQKTLRYFILFGLTLIGISLMVGLLSYPAQKTFIVIQTIFSIVSFVTVAITFIFVYFNTNERSLVLFSFLYFISFSFFLFYPQPEFGSAIFGVYVGQIFMYSNAFIIALVITISTVYRVLQIMNENEKLKKEMSKIHSINNFSLIQGQQNERTRVGRELHDGIGIMMSTIKMRLSALKVDNKTDKEKLKKYSQEVDVICQTIRQFSHTLLPPTLKKFGLQVALKDMLEQFKHQHKIELTYNFTIPDNLAPVSQQLIYDFLQQFIQYFSVSKPTQINISIYVIASIKEAQIRIQHTNSYTDLNHASIQSIISVINLLNAKFQNNILNARNSRIHLEFPILLEEHKKK